MQSTRAPILTVLCVFALCCGDIVWAANNVTDSSGRVWCVRAEISPAPVEGQDIYLYEEEGTFGEFIFVDKTLDTSPHVFLNIVGQIGIVWSRKNDATGRMEIYSTVYDQVSGLWVQPSSVLTLPPIEADHTEPRMEVSWSGTAHLVYVAKKVEDGRTVSSLVYRSRMNGAWSEPDTVSLPSEIVSTPELYLGASDQGYPLVLVYLSSPQPDGFLCLKQSSRKPVIKSLERNSGDPDPWMLMSKHRLPENTR